MHQFSLVLIGIVSLLVVVLPVVAADKPAIHSQLWGTNGEKWSPTSRLPDFSFAGYRRGEEAFRIPKQSISVKDFGAKGDGKTDDTEAFQKAIVAGAGKLIHIPAGRYVLNDILDLTESGTVLRGDGIDKTVLLFQKPLESIRPRMVKNDGGTPTSDWSWAGGLIMIGDAIPMPKVPDDQIISVSKSVLRGATELAIDKPIFKVGDEIILRMKDDAEQTLVKYLYRNDAGDISGLKTKWDSHQVFRITKVTGNNIQLDRGLRFDVRSEWQPTVRPFIPAVTDIGVESLTFEFPLQPYAGHFKEMGFNPCEISSKSANCWIKDVKIWNADSGPFVNGFFCTIDGITLGADNSRKDKNGQVGHHAVTLQGDDILCTNFDIQQQFIHDLTLQNCMGCVYSNGKAVNLCMDHHRWGPYENLYTNIDAGIGKRLFSSSGGDYRGKHSAAGATFWNIRTEKQVPYPKDFSPEEINIVGLNTSEKQLLTPLGRWIETIPPESIQPQDLYQAMLLRRLKMKK